MRATNVYPLGQPITLCGAFTDPAGDPVDPTDVICSVQDPAGTRTSPTVTKTETGYYTADIIGSIPGPWYYRFEGTGQHAAPTPDGAFRVQPTIFR